ncbi:hypothetical protein JM658_12790 [Joostella atrarenae]|uniref:Secreted protein n=1 Tax=Joostella atrarenae TaxID=679257 RepID=A0ABS9J5J3_9FLAO|nr:hypothetical protein [Joostella atrarenae]MCF8715705.1 hypothetical protein [Joostella atrarenae]
MKSFSHKILAISLALLVFLTTTSFQMDMHYCGDTLVDFSLFHGTSSCGMEKNQQSKTDCDIEISKKSCCSDQQIVNKGQDNFKASFDNLTFEQQTFIASFFYSYLNLYNSLEEKIIPFKDYTPPLIIKDVQKLHETYLI